ncbi:DEAD/DEAH box helicase [Clostridium fallax]|uniref:ATP-dependent RNA helicase DbpA n=1 Tax=Clostridium fallax TaxID=1533 RepID=A0A1M4SIQ7_9CLOT|nr:DEAD/DEAH box helicase [Clostridium fallax]SHE32154.1 ATP-dependent RNA helicase DbpA [Clostridium fallax]SQB07849.1 ATP-dependent RNA helicase [Clostridium fallax]
MNKINFSDLNLSNEIIKAIKGLKYDKATEVQEKVIPLALKEKDIIVKSQTGSGKTASFAIPLCEKINWDESKPQGLILTPTRELAVQVKEDISNIGRFKRIKAVAVFGKQPFSVQVRELKQRTHVVVGTPGRVLDHISRETISLENIKYLIIDEADEMLNMGFIDQVEEIINKISKNRTTMLFSATLPEDIENLCIKYMKNPIKIEIQAKALTADKVENFCCRVKEDNKFNLLRKFTVIENPDSAIIFCNTKDKVDDVFNRLKRGNYPSEKIHGGMMQQDRLNVMKDFKKGKFRYLVATDVAARGIDIDDITHVFNYDIPLEKESYVHRIGRTGRAGKKGKSITFVTPFEDRFLNEIEEYIGLKLQSIEEPSKDDFEKCKGEFENKIKNKSTIKRDKAFGLEKDIMKLYFNGGKKKKLRAGDFVGAISRIEGITADDIGIIDIQDNVSYIDILNGKGKIVLEALKNSTIKGKKLKVEKARS